LKAGDSSSDDSGTVRRWIAAAYLGLISSTFSTVVSQLSAARIGRDALVDWMSVAAIPTRDWALAAEPSVGAVAVGMAFHQWADFSWALVFFGVFGRWTGTRGPAWLAVAAVPWAILTSSLEWFVLVPLFPFWQPIFTLQQPYWIGFLVHLSSASMYRYSSGSVARPRSVEHCKDGHSFKYGAWPPLPESYSSGLLRSSPPTIANCLGSVGIRPSTRPSSGIC
jgi:hypothetical protein